MTRQISTIFEYLLGSIVLQSEIGSTVLQILQNHGLKDTYEFSYYFFDRIKAAFAETMQIVCQVIEREVVPYVQSLEIVKDQAR